MTFFQDSFSQFGVVECIFLHIHILLTFSNDENEFMPISITMRIGGNEE